MEQPDPRYAFDNSTNLTIDGCDLRQNLGVELLESLPERSSFRSLWVGEWNAFIHVAATDAKFSWVDEPSDVEES